MLKIADTFIDDYVDTYRVENGDDTLRVEVDEMIPAVRIENKIYRKLYVNRKDSNITYFLYKGKKWWEHRLKIIS